MDHTDREARVAEIAALDQPVRRDLYALLVARDDWVSRDDAVTALRLPRSVAAFHLDKLAEAGLVEVRFERPPDRGGPGAGRPAKLYRRSTREIVVSLPDRRYDLAAALLADAISEATATGLPAQAALAAAAGRTGRDMGAAVRAEGSTTDSAEATRAAAVRELQRLGYEPHERGGDVVLANCPFHRLAERHRSLVCGMNLDLLSGLTDGIGAAHLLVPRLDPAADMCCVRLEIT